MTASPREKLPKRACNCLIAPAFWIPFSCTPVHTDCVVSIYASDQHTFAAKEDGGLSRGMAEVIYPRPLSRGGFQIPHPGRPLLVLSVHARLTGSSCKHSIHRLLSFKFIPRQPEARPALQSKHIQKTGHLPSRTTKQSHHLLPRSPSSPCILPPPKPGPSYAPVGSILFRGSIRAP